MDEPTLDSRARHDQIFKKFLFEYEITCNIEICKEKYYLENIFFTIFVPIFVASWAH